LDSYLGGEVEDGEDGNLLGEAERGSALRAEEPDEGVDDNVGDADSVEGLGDLGEARRIAPGFRV